jgi:hypothetical protein
MLDPLPSTFLPAASPFSLWVLPQKTSLDENFETAGQAGESCWQQELLG